MIAALFVLAVALTGAPSQPVDATGLWKTPVDRGVIRIERCGADLCGRAVSSARLRALPDQKDARNRDPALRGRAIRGLLILKLHPLGPGRWGGGSVYNPDDGRTYKADLEMVGEGRLRLRGCIVAPFCRTQTWTRDITPQ
jgi:uncharacterized protein (DUF2147 family)